MMIMLRFQAGVSLGNALPPPFSARLGCIALVQYTAFTILVLFKGLYGLCTSCVFKFNNGSVNSKQKKGYSTAHKFLSVLCLS